MPMQVHLEMVSYVGKIKDAAKNNMKQMWEQIQEI
jgi:hypothetical protein